MFLFSIRKTSFHNLGCVYFRGEEYFCNLEYFSHVKTLILPARIIRENKNRIFLLFRNVLEDLSIVWLISFTRSSSVKFSRRKIQKGCFKNFKKKQKKTRSHTMKSHAENSQRQKISFATSDSLCSRRKSCLRGPARCRASTRCFERPSRYARRRQPPARPSPRTSFCLRVGPLESTSISASSLRNMLTRRIPRCRGCFALCYSHFSLRTAINRG